MRTRPPRLLLLTALTVATLASCVDHPDFLDAQKVRPWETKCDGDAPQCISSCGEGVDVGTAVCRNTMWSCDAGIRQDLCCDPVNAPDLCETFTTECSAASPCALGYTCVKSRLHPVPSDLGICRLGDLQIPPDVANCTPIGEVDPRVLPSLGPAPIKVHGVVEVSVVCDDRKCRADNACCQTCSGAYTIDIHEPPLTTHTFLPLRTETVSCAGTNCGFSCFPLQPGRRYTVWGLFLPDPTGVTPGTLYYSGHCAE